MRFIFKNIYILFFLISFIPLSTANEIYVSLKKNKVNVRYGPSFDSDIKFVYKKINLPLKQIDKKENFRRIIDHKKNSGWIHISQLRKSSSVIVLEDKILFKKASKFSKPLAKLKKGRLTIVKKCISSWCKVEVENYIGWINISNLWGRY